MKIPNRCHALTLLMATVLTLNLASAQELYNNENIPASKEVIEADSAELFSLVAEGDLVIKPFIQNVQAIVRKKDKSALEQLVNWSTMSSGDRLELQNGLAMILDREAEAPNSVLVTFDSLDKNTFASLESQNVVYDSLGRQVFSNGDGDKRLGSHAATHQVTFVLEEVVLEDGGTMQDAYVLWAGLHKDKFMFVVDTPYER